MYGIGKHASIDGYDRAVTGPFPSPATSRSIHPLRSVSMIMNSLGPQPVWLGMLESEAGHSHSLCLSLSLLLRRMRDCLGPRLPRTPLLSGRLKGRENSSSDTATALSAGPHHAKPIILQLSSCLVKPAYSAPTAFPTKSTQRPHFDERSCWLLHSPFAPDLGPES